MIIKMTIRDNDFTQLLEEFLQGDYIVKIKQEETTYEEVKEWFDNFNFFMMIFHKDFKNVSQEEKDKFISIIEKAFVDFIEKYEDEEFEKSSRDYVIKNFKIKLTDTLKIRWENGEVVYALYGQYGHSFIHTQ